MEKVIDKTEVAVQIQRYLDDIEIALKDHTGNIVIEYDGQVDVEAMSRAFELLFEANPVLRARITPDTKGYLLQVSSDYSPELEVFDGNGELIQKELDRPWDGSTGVTRLMLFREKVRGQLVLQVDHSVFDRNVIGILKDLWQIYTDIVQGMEVSITPGAALPQSPYEVMRRWLPDLPAATTSRAEPARKLVGRIMHRTDFDADQTEKIVNTARQNKLTVHGVLCGALLVAIRAQAAGAESVPLTCLSVVDIRTRINPPVDFRETANCFASHIAKVSVAPDDHPIDIGRSVVEQLSSAIEHRDVLIPGIGPSRSDAQSDGPTSYLSELARSYKLDIPREERKHIIAISNGGVLPEMPSPPGIRVTDMWPSSPTRGYTINQNHAFLTFNKRLHLTSLYPDTVFTEAEANEMSRNVGKSLAAIM